MLRQTVGTVLLMSANSSNTFRYNYPEYGIDGNMSTNAKFIAYDKDSFWYQVHFDGVYCVDQVMTLDLEVYSHSWTCTETGCGDPCQGVMCKYVEVTVLNGENKQITSEQSKSCQTSSSYKMPANCGTGARISISLENAKTLGYDYFEVQEFLVTGRKPG